MVHPSLNAPEYLALWWFDAEILWNSGDVWQVFSHTSSTLSRTESLVALQIAPSNGANQTLHEVMHDSHHKVGDVYGTTGPEVIVRIFLIHFADISCLALAC